VIDYPHLVVIARSDGDRLESDRDRADVSQLTFPDTEDLEAIVRRVDREQMLAVGRQRQRADLALSNSVNDSPVWPRRRGAVVGRR